ncbi:MAG: MBL fold metallo-hydrolase [Chloroflexi bacterium]|nr:MBL fold metallo-hydrolase [Chloroflexota bacterium]
MTSEIKVICYGGVNCFLIKADNGYVLIDSGVPSKRADLEKEIEKAGCEPGNLKLIVLTHGDYDHAGNCAYLREKYGTRVAMHNGDFGMVDSGDWNWNRKAKPDKAFIIFRIVSFFVRPSNFDTFRPDLIIEEDYDLSAYGFDAKVLHIPGHSKGSIGILTSGGDLFCGDLLYNIFGKPGIRSIDDLADFEASIEKLKMLDINTVFPGHGKPFPMEVFMKRQ